MKHCLAKISMAVKNRVCRYHETLVELIAGIIPVTVLAGAVGAVFVSEKLSFCLSLVLGAAAAVFLAIHMFVTIDRSLDMFAEDACKYSKRNYVLRLIFMVLLVLCGLKLPGIHFPGLFIGLLTLKASVYLRPVSHRLISKLYEAAEIS